MLEKSIPTNIELDYDRSNENDHMLSNAMTLDEMLTLYVDIKIKSDFKESIKIDDEGNKNESQTRESVSFDKLNYFKSDAIKLRITNYTNKAKIIIDEINNKIHQMKTLNECRSSCVKCTTKVNTYNHLMKKIDQYKKILHLELPVYHNEYCVSEESICNQIELMITSLQNI
jgi:hypothetical protein